MRIRLSNVEVVINAVEVDDIDHDEIRHSAGKTSSWHGAAREEEAEGAEGAISSEGTGAVKGERE
jgi:hypothetical protein